MPPEATATPDPNVILLQVLGAIAQGAATIRVGYSAAEFVQRTYLPRIEASDRQRWPEYRLLVLEWARALGRQSAANAVGRGAYEIEDQDVEASVDRLRAASAPDGVCPFC